MIASLKTKSPLWPAPMVPLWIAESVCDEAARFLGVDLPERYAVWLTAKAERCMAGHAHVQARMQERGNGGRNALRVYMRHWLAGLLQIERPDLARALPPAFDLGQALPPEKAPRENRRNRLPLPSPMEWNPNRVLQHRQWRFLAATRRPPTRQCVRPVLPQAALREFPIC